MHCLMGITYRLFTQWVNTRQIFSSYEKNANEESVIYFMCNILYGQMLEFLYKYVGL